MDAWKATTELQLQGGFSNACPPCCCCTWRGVLNGSPTTCCVGNKGIAPCTRRPPLPLPLAPPEWFIVKGTASARPTSTGVDSLFRNHHLALLGGRGGMLDAEALRAAFGADDFDAASWSVKGEGAANMVLAYNGSSRQLVGQRRSRCRCARARRGTRGCTAGWRAWACQGWLRGRAPAGPQLGGVGRPASGPSSGGWGAGRNGTATQAARTQGRHTRPCCCIMFLRRASGALSMEPHTMPHLNAHAHPPMHARSAAASCASARRTPPSHLLWTRRSGRQSCRGHKVQTSM